MTSLATTGAELSAPPPGIGAGLLDDLLRQLPSSARLHRARAPFDGTPLPLCRSPIRTRWPQRPSPPVWHRHAGPRRPSVIARRSCGVFARALITHERQLCDLMQWETGKARVHAAIEVQGVVQVATYYGRTGAAHLAPRRAASAVPGVVAARVRYRPKGLVGVIAPWNYPLFLAVGDVIPALVAGNAVVSKADSQTPLTLLLARKLAVDAGLRPDLWQVVTGPAAGSGRR